MKINLNWDEESSMKVSAPFQFSHPSKGNCHKKYEAMTDLVISPSSPHLPRSLGVSRAEKYFMKKYLRS